MNQSSKPMTQPTKPSMPKACISQNEVILSDCMDTLWEQHVFWTRLFLISVAENLQDLEPTKQRLLRNPKDIANVYRVYYGDDIANNIEELITEHLEIGGNLIVALKNNDSSKAEMLDNQWHQNADDIAKYFNSFNPYYGEKEVREMFYEHLRLTSIEVGARLNKQYEQDIKAFDTIEQEALMMAKYFSDGIIMQFPEYFKA